MRRGQVASQAGEGHAGARGLLCELAPYRPRHSHRDRKTKTDITTGGFGAWGDAVKRVWGSFMSRLVGMSSTLVLGKALLVLGKDLQGHVTFQMHLGPRGVCLAESTPGGDLTGRAVRFDRGKLLENGWWT